MDYSTALIPISTCREIISNIDARASRPLSPDQAVDAAKFLIGLYPGKEVSDPDIFMRGVIAVMVGEDFDMVRRAIDPATGLPSKLTYLPTIAEIKAAIEAAKTHRFKVRATAQWMLDEHERRRLAAEEEAQFNLTPEALERRKAQVAALLKGTPFPGELRRQKTPESHLVIPPDEEPT